MYKHDHFRQRKSLFSFFILTKKRAHTFKFFWDANPPIIHMSLSHLSSLLHHAYAICKNRKREARHATVLAFGHYYAVANIIIMLSYFLYFFFLHLDHNTMTSLQWHWILLDLNWWMQTIICMAIFWLYSWLVPFNQCITNLNYFDSGMWWVCLLLLRLRENVK